jgi:hypothetical protein
MTMSVKLPMMNADRATDKNMKNVAQIVSAMFWAAEHRLRLSTWRVQQKRTVGGSQSQQDVLQCMWQGRSHGTPVKSP